MCNVCRLVIFTYLSSTPTILHSSTGCPLRKFTSVKVVFFLKLDRSNYQSRDPSHLVLYRRAV